jgi:hypothetical protein
MADKEIAGKTLCDQSIFRAILTVSEREMGSNIFTKNCITTV